MPGITSQLLQQRFAHGSHHTTIHCLHHSMSSLFLTGLRALKTDFSVHRIHGGVLFPACASPTAGPGGLWRPTAGRLLTANRRAVVTANRWAVVTAVTRASDASTGTHGADSGSTRCWGHETVCVSALANSAPRNAGGANSHGSDVAVGDGSASPLCHGGSGGGAGDARTLKPISATVRFSRLSGRSWGITLLLTV